MASLTTLKLLTLSIGLAIACPQLKNPHLTKRQGVNGTLPEENRFWAYEASYDWGRLNSEWERCQAGTQQSPIPLRLDQGLARNHILDFHYPDSVTGDFHNWGYGLAYTLDKFVERDLASLPTVVFSENGHNETVYLASWHVHTPADHTVQGDRQKAELHLVHADAHGDERAVMAIRVDPGNANSAFFAQLPTYIGYNATEDHTLNVPMNLNDALREVNYFNDFWTYRGSLTSPPCTEGLRWFVARTVMYVTDEQMQGILRVSTYSAREEQQVWRHDINK